MTPALPRIWIITDPSHPDGPVIPARRALEKSRPGLVGVQLRAKRASDRQLLQWGRELRAVTRATGSVLLVNRRADVAQIVGADGVHLPERGLRATDIRDRALKAMNTDRLSLARDREHGAQECVRRACLLSSQEAGPVVA